MGMTDKKLVNQALVNKLQTVREFIGQGVANEMINEARAIPERVNRIDSGFKRKECGEVEERPRKRQDRQGDACRERGHFANRCPKVKCHACGEFGHTQRHCRNTKKIVAGERKKLRRFRQRQH